MPDPSRKYAICDANILIDFMTVDEDMLREIAGYWKAVYVPDVVLHEVPVLTEQRAKELNLSIVETPYREIKKLPGLSYEDSTCLYFTVSLDAVCITNDKALREACICAGHEAVWGLEMMLKLVEIKKITKARAIDDARKIQQENAQIPKSILGEFIDKVNAL